MTTPILSESLIETILAALPTLTIGVLGDLFLDRYLDIDPSLTETSIETGLDAFQVVRVRSYPGAAGTVLNNLAALEVGRVVPLTVIGDDGEGYELLQALRQVPCVDSSRIISTETRRTPTYTKPMFHEPAKVAREGNRLDIRNRQPMAEPFQAAVCQHLNEVWPSLNGLVVLDQVSEAECGVVTERVRQLLATLGQAHPERFILADSRDQIARFSGVSLKPNQSECLRAVLGQTGTAEELMTCINKLATHCGRAVFCTCGEKGIYLVDPADAGGTGQFVPGFPVQGPIDPVGAGDSTSAGIICALAAGAKLDEAAAFGCLVASITVQQIGTTGTATPNQVRQQWFTHSQK